MARKYDVNGNIGSIARAHHEASLLSPESDRKYQAAKKHRVDYATESAHRELLERVAAVYFGASDFTEDETGRGFVRRGGIVLSIDWASWKKAAPLEVRVYVSTSGSGVDSYSLRNAVESELTKCAMTTGPIKVNWKASPAQVVEEIMTHFFSFETFKGIREQCIAELKSEAYQKEAAQAERTKWLGGLGIDAEGFGYAGKNDSVAVRVQHTTDELYKLKLDTLTRAQIEQVLAVLG